jgi:hypothetical protein
MSLVTFNEHKNAGMMLFFRVPSCFILISLALPHEQSEAYAPEVKVAQCAACGAFL